MNGNTRQIKHFAKMMAVRSKHERSHLQHAIVNRLLVDVSRFAVYSACYQ